MTVAGEEQESGLDRRIDDLRTELRERDMVNLARNTGASYVNGCFGLDVWNRAVTFSEEDFVAIDAQSGQECDALTQAMLAYYFYTSDGAAVHGELIAFRELPDGQFYASAFQGYTGNKLAGVFGNDIEAFAKAAHGTGGKSLVVGDAAYQFQALPRVPVAVVCWLGDEDFPTSYRVLFDKSIDHHLPTDACAILGSMLTAKLGKAMAQGVAS